MARLMIYIFVEIVLLAIAFVDARLGHVKASGTKLGAHETSTKHISARHRAGLDGCDFANRTQNAHNSTARAQNSSSAIFALGTDSKLNCKLDTVIMLDGSSSVGGVAWEQAKQAAVDLIQIVRQDRSTPKVALQLFGGPKSTDEYELCMSSGAPKNVKEHCGIEWVSRFDSGDDTAALVDKAQHLAPPGGSAYTSYAMGWVESELMYSRPDAPVIIVVITAGKPLSDSRLGDACHEVRSSSVRIVWVLIGGHALTSEMYEWYSTSSDVLYQLHNSQAPDEVMGRVICDACSWFGR